MKRRRASPEADGAAAEPSAGTDAADGRDSYTKSFVQGRVDAGKSLAEVLEEFRIGTS